MWKLSPSEGKQSDWTTSHRRDFYFRIAKIRYKYLWRTDVGLIRLGQDGDEHGEGAVVVQDAKDQPDPKRDMMNMMNMVSMARAR